MIYTFNNYEIDALTNRIAQRVCKEMPELPPEAHNYIQSICHDEISQIIKKGDKNEEMS